MEYRKEIRSELKTYYDGYHFATDMKDVYNPFSLINVFARQTVLRLLVFRAPLQLIFLRAFLEKNTMKLKHLSGFQDLARASSAQKAFFTEDPIVSLFQSGYLTIKSFDFQTKPDCLDYPNREVKESFLNFLSCLTTRAFLSMALTLPYLSLSKR